MNNINKSIGVWIDHHHAEIVIASTGYEQLSMIVNRAGAHRLRKSQQLRDKFYENVITQIQEASSLLVFGPDQAKDALLERIAQRAASACSIRVETCGVMTTKEIIVKVRGYFRAQLAAPIAYSRKITPVYP